MAENSHIEWTHHTFNPWWGCTKVSAGCKNCYAETLDGRFHKDGHWGPNAGRKPMSDANWRQPLKWNRWGRKAGVRHRVFCASMADVFELHADHEVKHWQDTQRERLWALIAQTPHLDWLLLTKRPENIMEMVPRAWCHDWPANVWVGTSVEDQAAANERIPYLLQVPAPVRFLSCEPLLGPVELVATGYLSHDGAAVLHGANANRIDWVIAGGESGHCARPMRSNWVTDLRDQCIVCKVPFFFKQWGEYVPRVLNFDSTPTMIRVGKKEAGRLLHGKVWQQFPQPQEVAAQ